MEKFLWESLHLKSRAVSMTHENTGWSWRLAVSKQRGSGCNFDFKNRAAFEERNLCERTGLGLIKSLSRGRASWVHLILSPIAALDLTTLMQKQCIFCKMNRGVWSARLFRSHFSCGSSTEESREGQRSFSSVKYFTGRWDWTFSKRQEKAEGKGERRESPPSPKDYA